MRALPFLAALATLAIVSGASADEIHLMNFDGDTWTSDNAAEYPVVGLDNIGLDENGTCVAPKTFEAEESAPIYSIDGVERKKVLIVDGDVQVWMTIESFEALKLLICFPSELEWTV